MTKNIDDNTAAKSDKASGVADFQHPGDASGSDNLIIQKSVEINGQWSALAQVADACDLSRAQLTDAAEKGAVWWQKSLPKSKHKNPVRIRDIEQTVAANDLVLVNYNRDVLASTAVAPELISDQVNYSIWHKPAGVLSQGSKWSDHCSITCLVEKIHGKRALLVHRLDRAASGLIVIAHTKNAVTALAGLFEKRQVEKTYRAVVQGHYKEQLPQVIEIPVDDKPAHTEIVAAVIISVDPDSKTKDRPSKSETALTVKIATGRKHQIRSHMSSVGYPVVGDRLFDPETVHRQDLQLTAVALKFVCPFTSREQSFTLPDNLLPGGS